MSMFEDQPDKQVDWGQRGSQVVLTLASLFIVLAGMKIAANLLLPVVYAFFLAVLSYPMVRFLRRKRWPTPLALGLTMFMNLAVLAGLITLAVRLCISFYGDLPRYVKGLAAKIGEMAMWLEQQGLAGAKAETDRFFDWNNMIDWITRGNVMSSLGAMLGSTFGVLGTVFAGLVIILLLMMFILMEAQGTRRRLLAVKLSGGPDFTGLLRSADDIQKYLGVKTLISALTGVLAGVLCWFFDLQYPLLWAILAFVFNFVPAVGSTAASLPAIAEAFVQHGPAHAAVVAIGYGGINFCLDNFVQPHLLGNRFGISPLVVILSVIFWGWLLGPLGMFLAVPLTMVIKVILDNSEEFRWLSVAMAKKKVRRGEVEVAGYDLHLAEGETIGSGAATEMPGMGKRPDS
jgi:AI-2 transport protein TqsA